MQNKRLLYFRQDEFKSSVFRDEKNDDKKYQDHLTSL